MIAYEGKSPFAFVSYSHANRDEVFKIIQFLKMRMCRIWYDEGLHAGESWNKEIAEHLNDSSIFLLFLTPESVVSKYVFLEINYAVNKNKKIIPIILKKTELSSEIELLLSATQFIDVSGETDLHRIGGIILSQLPKNIVSLMEHPFLQDSGYSFYFRTQMLERNEIPTKTACTIVCVDEHGEETEIFNINRLGAYEAYYSLSAVEEFKDFFYSGKISGSYQINIKGVFNLEYPLYGPDVDVLLICILRIPRHSPPTFKLIDYQYITCVGSNEDEDINTVGEKGWSKQIKDYLEGKLYQ